MPENEPRQEIVDKVLDELPQREAVGVDPEEGAGPVEGGVVLAQQLGQGVLQVEAVLV